MASSPLATTNPHDDWCGGIRPYAPLSRLHELAEGIWWVDGPVCKMRVGPFAFPFPTRMVVVRLRTGGLWLWSPTAPTPELQLRIETLGRVEHLVSPNKLHYAGISAWKERCPGATAWASPGVRERAKRQRIPVTFDADLGDQPPPAWSADLDQLVFRGSRFVEEVVFFHRASSTLILADLIVALERDRVRPFLRSLFALAGALAPGQTPREVRASFWGRKTTARAYDQRMLQWQPRRLVIAHGRLEPDDASDRLRRAFAWLG